MLRKLVVFASAGRLRARPRRPQYRRGRGQGWESHRPGHREGGRQEQGLLRHEVLLRGAASPDLRFARCARETKSVVRTRVAHMYGAR